MKLELHLKHEYTSILRGVGVKVGERGQVTIPRALRGQFGFLPETEVEFTVQGGALLLVKKEKRSEVAKLYGRKQFEHSTDDLMKLLR